MKIEIMSNGNDKLAKALQEKLEKDFSGISVSTSVNKEQEILKQTQIKMNEKFGWLGDGDFKDHVQELTRHIHKDNWDLAEERIHQELCERLEILLKEILDSGKPPWGDKDIFDQVVKLVYVLNHRNELDGFEMDYPQYKQVLEYLLGVGIRSGKAINNIAPEYNDLLG